jgi:polar amino acid transport system substrate-binding protein
VWFLCLCLFLPDASSAAAQVSREGGKHVVLTESELAWEKSHPVVYWGVDPQWPPFSSLDAQGRISGIDVEIVKLLAERTGLNMQLVKTETWSETLQKAGTGELDVVGGIAHTEERQRLYGLEFTEVYCKFPTAIVTRRDTPFLALLDELKSQRIAVPRNYATTEELQKLYPEVRLVLTENEEQSMLMVAGNRADATVLNLASASYVVHMRGLSNLKISGFTELDFFLSLAVRKGAPELHSILEKGLATIDPREKETIYAGYILPETLSAIDWKAWRRRAIYSLLAGAAVATGMLLWNRRLAREIRRRKSAEAALVQAWDKLEARAGEMELLNRELTYANKDLESFSYSVSHDLKSPLRRMGSFAELLERDAGTRLRAQERQYVDVIRNEAGRMNKLIEALLSFARIGHGQIHFEPVNLERLIRGIVARVGLEMKGREILWDIHPLPEVECDRALINQVAENLIDNAVKFTRGRAPARIEIGVLPEKAKDEEVVFYVKDNGAGFEMDQVGMLFRTFHRLHTEREYEGTGIGLANVQRIIQKHGGHVWAEGAVGKGATFYFSLPRQQRQANGSAEHERDSAMALQE